MMRWDPAGSARRAAARRRYARFAIRVQAANAALWFTRERSACLINSVAKRTHGTFRLPEHSYVAARAQRLRLRAVLMRCDSD
jgi:hypothetical protein